MWETNSIRNIFLWKIYHLTIILSGYSIQFRTNTYPTKYLSELIQNTFQLNTLPK